MILAGLAGKASKAAAECPLVLGTHRNGEPMLFRRSKPDLNDNAPPVLETGSVTVIGADTEITGDLASGGDVRIEGTMRGALRAKRCIVEAEGFVEGEIIAEEIVVRGRVDGPLRGYLVHLQDGAQLRGDVVNERIVIDQGAEITGAVRRSDDPLNEERASRESAHLRSAARFESEPLWPNLDGGSSRPLTAIRPR